MNFFLTRWAGFESFERLESLGLRRALTSWRCWTGLRHCGWRKILGVIRVWILLDWRPTEGTDSQVEFRIRQCQSKVLPELRACNFFFLIPFWLNLICRSLRFSPFAVSATLFLCIKSAVLVVASFTLLHVGSALFEERDTSHFGADSWRWGGACFELGS